MFAAAHDQETMKFKVIPNARHSTFIGWLKFFSQLFKRWCLRFAGHHIVRPLVAPGTRNPAALAAMRPRPLVIVGAGPPLARSAFFSGQQPQARMCSWAHMNAMGDAPACNKCGI